MKYIKFILLPFLLLVALYVLFFQPEILGISLDENGEFPLGTVISWLIVFLYSLILHFVLTGKKGKPIPGILKIIVKVNVVSGAFWGVVSYFLAGNWNFVFNSNTTFFIWIGFTLIILFIPILVSVILGFWRLKNRLFSK